MLARLYWFFIALNSSDTGFCIGYCLFPALECKLHEGKGLVLCTVSQVLGTQKVLNKYVLNG